MCHTRKAELNLFLPATDTQAIAFPTEMRTPLFLIVNLICEREKRKKNNKKAKETDEPEARVLGGSRASHGAASAGRHPMATRCTIQKLRARKPHALHPFLYPRVSE